MRNFALSTAAVSCTTLTWTGEDSIYTVFGAGDYKTALETAAGTDDAACATQGALLLKDATIATATLVNAICDAAGTTAAEQITALAATIATNIATASAPTMANADFDDCDATGDGAKVNGIAVYSTAAAQVLSDNKADICPETSSASTVSVMAAIAALAIRLL